MSGGSGVNKVQVSRYYVQIIASNDDCDFLRLIDTYDGIYKQRKANTYRCSIRLLPEVLDLMRPGYSVENLPDEIKEYFQMEMIRRQHTTLLKELGPDRTSDLEHTWLWPHQCLGIELAQVNSRYNFFYDTRTGKTLMALRIMYERLTSNKARRCLVICPSHIIPSWLKDASDWFPRLKIVAYYGTPEQRYTAFNTPAHIVIWATNHVVPNLAILKECGFDTCFFDESSAAKSHSSKISEAVLELSQCIPSWYNLSATPAPNDESEYYVQMRALDAYCFNPARTKFVDKYFNNTSRNNMYQKLRIKPDMYDEFMGVIEEYSIYVDQAAMPTAGKEWHVEKYALDEELRARYNDMCGKMYMEVNGTKITIEMATALRAKLNQLASGFVLDTEAINDNKISRKLKEPATAVETYELSTGRIEKLLELFARFPNEKIVVWANYRAEFKMIEDVLGERARYLNGASDLAYKEEAIKAFKTGPLQYLICHPLSVGMGINLAESHIAIYYSMNDSWEAFKQSSERIYGHIKVQPNVCHYYILQAEKTANELVYTNVTNKRDASYGLLEHLKARSLEA